MSEKALPSIYHHVCKMALILGSNDPKQLNFMRRCFKLYYRRTIKQEVLDKVVNTHFTITTKIYNHINFIFVSGTKLTPMKVFKISLYLFDSKFSREQNAVSGGRLKKHLLDWSPPNVNEKYFYNCWNERKY